MKNVFVLPTDKPSRLSKDENDRIWLSINFEYGINDNNKQNIFITSDEEIKEGDWFLHPFNTLHKAGGNLIDKDFRKIILTTDGDLIKEGVQAIDDEFLQWYVKNPSCEEIEVSEDYFKPSNMVYGHDTEPYKIIIPKEEVLLQSSIDGEVIWGEKQETLEEVKDLSYWRNNAEEDYSKVPISVLKYISELEKQQDKNKYNEEDMFLAFETGRNFQLTGENNFKELIEQLKKNKV